MRAVDVMSRPVLTIRSDDSIERAAAVLIANNISSAPVVDPTGELVGIVSEGDLLRGRVPGLDVSAAGERPEAVSDVMSTNVVVMPPDADLADLAEAMLYNDVHSVPVVDDMAQLTGIVSRRDLLRSLVRSDDTVAMEVQRRLDEYAGEERRWSVSVVDGVVSVTGRCADDVEAKLVEILARTVAGVSEVRLTAAH